jgi:hypothetical protein
VEIRVRWSQPGHRANPDALQHQLSALRKARDELDTLTDDLAARMLARKEA